MDDNSLTPVPMQLYAILDDPEQEEREDCTQFVMESRDTLMDAIDFLNETMAPDLWGVSHVELVGIVPLSMCENRDTKPRKVLATFPLERIFVPGHQDCLVVVPTEAANSHDNSTNT